MPLCTKASQVAGALSAIGLLLVVLPISSTPAQSRSTPPCESENVVPAGPAELKADCEALWDFYLQLDDRASLNWGPDIPLFEWDGVERSYYDTPTCHRSSTAPIGFARNDQPITWLPYSSRSLDPVR